MSSNIVELPYKYYPDPTKGKPVYLGYIYIGEPNTDPEVLINRKVVNMTGGCVCPDEGTEISQPIRTTAGGVPEFNGSPVILSTDGNYSIKVLNSKGDQVYYSGSVENNDSALNFTTLQDAVENTSAKVDDAANLAERTPGNGGGAMWDYVDITTVTTNSYWIVACTGVPTLALVLRESSVYNLSAYGVTGADAVSDTAAWLSALDRIILKGGGSLVQNSDLLISAVSGQVLASLDGLKSFSHKTNGHKIHDVKTDWLDDETFTLYDLKNIGYLGLSIVAESQPSILISEPVLADRVPKVGMRTITLQEGCESGVILLDQVGGERGVAFSIPVISPLPTDVFSGNMTVNIKTYQTHYPFRATGNGKNLTVNLTCEDVGRPWYIYGNALNITVNASTKNTLKTGLINSFDGFGTSGVTINAEDTETVTFADSTPYIGVRFGDTTPATHSNLKIKLNLKAKAASGWLNGLELAKFDSGSADPTGRGHKIKGLELSGVIDFSDSTPATNPLFSTGTFTGPDSISGIDIRNIELKGGTSVWQLTDSLNESATVTNLDSDSNFRFLHTTGRTVFTNATALNLSNNTGDTSSHTYIDCNVTDGSSQSLINKTFINTLVGGDKRNTYKMSALSESNFTSQVVGDLSSPVSLVRVKQNQVQIEVEYYAVQDRTAGTRVEAFGAVAMTATVNSGGMWGTYQAQSQYIAEKLSTAPSPAFTINLVNGDSTGGLIAISSASFNNANGRGVFRVNVKSLDGELIASQA